MQGSLANPGIIPRAVKVSCHSRSVEPTQLTRNADDLRTEGTRHKDQDASIVLLRGKSG
jgi:hypothetical protein